MLRISTLVMVVVLVSQPAMAADTYCQPEPFGGLEPPEDGTTFEEAVAAVHSECEAGDSLVLLLPSVARNQDILKDEEIIAGHLCNLSDRILFGNYSKERRWHVIICTLDGPKARRG